MVSIVHGEPSPANDPRKSHFSKSPKVQGYTPSTTYLKVALCDLDTPDEYMLLISAHPDH
jgi:hypothetical protein